MPKEPLEAALNELRGYDALSRQQPLWKLFAHIERHARSFLEAVQLPTADSPRCEAPPQAPPQAPPRARGAIVSSPPGQVSHTEREHTDGSDSSRPRTGLGPTPTPVAAATPVSSPPLRPSRPSVRLTPRSPRLLLWQKQICRWSTNGCRPRLAWRMVGGFGTPGIVRALLGLSLACQVCGASHTCIQYQVVDWPRARKFLLKPFQTVLHSAMTSVQARRPKPSDVMIFMVPLAECQIPGCVSLDGNNLKASVTAACR